VVLCSGKVYYDLLQKAEELDLKNVALVRVEQLYPFPDEDIQNYLKEFKDAKDVVWCQEEPKNMGAWFFVSDRIQQLLSKGQKLRYAGRQASASPAAGQKKIHDAEQEQLVGQALGIL
jgi:2-oxoglutarate dehydrogenase E1 component